MQWYTLILSLMVIGVTVVAGIISVDSYNQQIRQAKTYARQRVASALLRYQEVTTDFARQLGADQSNLSSLEAYFAMSVPAYANYALDAADKGGNYFNWPQQASNFFTNHDEVDKLELVLTSGKNHYMATREHRTGKILPKAQVSSGAFVAPLINSSSQLDSAGTLGLTFNDSRLIAQLRQSQSPAHMQILVVNDRGALLTHYADSSVTAGEKADLMAAFKKNKLNSNSQYTLTTYEVGAATVNQQATMIVAINRSGLANMMIWHILPIAGLGLMVLLLLGTTLWITFLRYQRQLSTIVTTVSAVSSGNLNAQVPIVSSHTDLAELASGINTMLDDINQYINTIYKLQMAQQQASMKALQAQINPHFMSNTLEYIRMAALDADQPDLARVVYSFAALLRNNTDLSAVATLDSELTFIEKYIYLYQVRFPDRLAYQVEIDPTLRDLEMPKFSLQPLVENYFVHGVDFSRHDNAISIKATRTATGVRIVIKDNGKGVIPADLARLNVRMTEPLGSAQHESIGLQNVYARMSNYFGPSFRMRLQGNDQGGTSVVVSFEFDPRTMRHKEALLPTGDAQ
ncbi:sensor histidine kinase [Lacticaseibacillus parakribbianus]|uniref:sensor histidine kinase n=1 Tax=Lacticaseibacillus parakribbianus TaxID=2970927 RepID=UPI0021CB7A31|nr:sensor histidine kinase [Lacticaseibacillus parakribbianus]